MNAVNRSNLTNALMTLLPFAGRANHGGLVGDTFPGFLTFGHDADHADAIAARLVACWNACAGMGDPLVEIARLRAAQLSTHLGDGVASLLPDHVDATGPGPWHVVDCSGEPSMVLTDAGTWALYPDREAMEFSDLDAACDFALGYGGDVVPVVRVAQ